ncbi:hypothetical protein FQN57_003778 [Myotisia sp. PD_48]|nr:hypothetical protein FQN57_003778 [Myotisia sp. PD_48]
MKQSACLDLDSAGDVCTVASHTEISENSVGGLQTDMTPNQEPPSSPSPKHVAFELLLDQSSKMRARIPMRVQIFPHDTTDSIVTTVKNFYGIYEGTVSGVSFEDQDGNTLIARYENLRNSMTVYVRVIPNSHYPDHHSQQPYNKIDPMDGYTRRPTLGEPFHMALPQQAHDIGYGQPVSRPTSRVAGRRSDSPPARGRRSVSRQKSSRAGNKSRGSSTHGSFHDDAHVTCNESDGALSSSTKKSKPDHFASSDISMENILQDGRRKRPKFESSELPLFAPPQVPRTTSTSSVSPQRRSSALDASPFAKPAQHPFSGYQPFPSPRGFGHHEKLHALHGGVNASYVPSHGHRLRNRAASNSVGYPTSGYHQGILPTPDPTIASCISDEDVAMQLIRLGDASNFSSHGRTSTSTIDDAFSGVADGPSSTGVTTDMSDVSDNEDQFSHKARARRDSSASLPPGLPRKHKSLDEILPSCESSDQTSEDIDGEYLRSAPQENIKSEFDDEHPYAAQSARAKRVKKSSTATSMKAPPNKQPLVSKAGRITKSRPATTTSRKGKTIQNIGNNKMVPPPLLPAGAQPTSMNPPSQLAPNEEDLSTKPRCQRCRKSKKGCDRQRPCGRCKDAGIGIAGCVSEDEGNGRKGRYGRHMGVPVTTETSVVATARNTQAVAAPSTSTPITADGPTNNRKRKR